MAKLGEHAVVLGASMGGLVAARVLSDFYDHVTVVERDVLPPDAANRRGVPQGRHVHALLGRGSAVLDELFPAFTDELVGAGAPAFDYQDMAEAYFSFAGHEMSRTGALNVPSIFLPSRPLLETLVGQRLRAIENVALFDGYDVVDLASTPESDRVTGVRIRRHSGDDEQLLAADLVADATGRGSRTPVFLEGMGYGRPKEDSLQVRLAYSSQLLRLPPGTLEEKLVLIGAVPGRPSGMAFLGYENDTWMFTVFGMAGVEPPCQLADMLSYAEGFAPAHVLGAISNGEPLADVCRYRYPETRWRRYDKMRRFPAGLVVLGDAICSFNPVYGQGMTVAALQALALGACLRRGGDELARRYFREAAKPISVAWQFAVGADLSLPEVEGPRPWLAQLSNRYVSRLQTVAETDSAVAQQFFRVTGLLDPPATLLHPRMLLRAARPRRRHQRAAEPALTPT
ncbi:2-polyprenyl-6-methoxyphenol hydroxylase-like FAD-dependent oxidoreductase [Mycobacterium sp. OAS707]|uniref:FAD-dependent oxidoreductase n=1 Tax=Mycobacterium sp. OAS707 TaxID=2663822 RepID=UPI00178A40DD|nr:2-polyprenyl-6-methoxyphenol hydroxylase-like oxidoreductase [Mycobacterium sp. OAS707]MBE1551404.1 2-polyprenyl-6-methoxyphenol hydroxylase-like FAD-dependent oxidoreductase [Mycobacterium sp. OAS707]